MCKREKYQGWLLYAPYYPGYVSKNKKSASFIIPTELFTEPAEERENKAIRFIIIEDPFLTKRETIHAMPVTKLNGEWIVHFSGPGLAGRLKIDFPAIDINQAQQQAEKHEFIDPAKVKFFSDI